MNTNASEAVASSHEQPACGSEARREPEGNH